MILCVAPNPSIDKLFEVDRLEPGGIHRPTAFTQVPGGKGLNVARAAATLGADVHVVALLGGHAGRWVADEIRLPLTTVWTTAETRSCLSVADKRTGSLTEFYESGPAIAADEWAEFVRTVAALAPSAEWTAVSGSLPPGVHSSREPKFVISRTATVWLADDAGRRTDPALEVEARHPGPRPDRALVRRRRGAARGHRRLPGRDDVLVLDLHPPGVVEPRVVALGDHRDDEVGRARRVHLELDPARRVVDPAQLQGRGQVDRRLGRAPLGRGDEARALAGAVEHRAAGRQRPGEGVLGQHQHADPGAGDAAALGRGRLVADGSSRGRGRPRRRRARSWWDRSAGTRSRFPGRGRAAWAHPTRSGGFETGARAPSSTIGCCWAFPSVERSRDPGGAWSRLRSTDDAMLPP